tara:strand:- start:4938 stop:6032 length:1095 start_codon:yes stop_codon:yes gene_type:complete
MIINKYKKNTFKNVFKIKQLFNFIKSLKKMKKTTIVDISKATGFAKSTVSKALNNSKEISKKTKKKINSFAKKLNYQPNFFARNLRKNNIKNVGIIIPDILNYYFAKVIKGAQKEFFKNGYDLVCFFNEESTSKEKKILEKLKNGSVSGLLISLARNPYSENIKKTLKDFKSLNTPIVMFDRVLDDFKCDKVLIDDFNSTFDSVKHLVSAGKRKIAFVSPIHDTIIGRKRYDGYVDGLKSENIKFDKDLYIPLTKGDTIESEITKLSSNGRIDAIICIEQHTTISILSLLLNLGYKVPKDIAIIGFTDGPIFKYVKPSITSIDQHGEYVGKLSAKLLIKRIENYQNEDFIHEMVPTSLIKRNST